ncbi:MAG: NF038120 family PEP-CTERM protein [Pseudomonadota bacterium]
MNHKGKFVLSSTWRTFVGAAALCLAASMPVQAAVVTFEDVPPNLTAFGESLSSGGYKFTDDNVGGFIGIDSAAAFAAAPANSAGQFLYMLNAAGVIMTSEAGSGFFLSSFDVAFISPIPGLAGALPGRLAVDLYDLSGVYFATEFFDLPSGAAGGDFPFESLSLTNTAALSQAYFYSCSFQPDGNCEFFGQSPPAQFALDNISNAVVPEPGTAVLALTAFGLIVIRRRPIARA